MPGLEYQPWLFYGGTVMANTMTESRTSEQTHSALLSSDQAALWACFLHEGLVNSSLPESRESEVLESWGMGCIELMTATCRYLPLLWSELYQHEREHSEHPSVFEYDVVSVLGEYLGDYLLENDGELPSDSKVRRIIHYLVRDFFTVLPGETKPTAQISATQAA
jgi:hypothetical protein